MRIAIYNVQLPYVRGGAEFLGDALADRLRGAGHEVDQVRLPFQWHPAEEIPRHMMAARLVRAGAGRPDLVIALKFPAYLVPFANKKVWLLHQFRQAYELWDSPHRELPHTPEGERIRRMIVEADNRHLREARQLFTNSRIVARRLRQNNGIEADEVLYVPLARPEAFRPGDFGDYVFYPSRMCVLKRQHLAVEAMRHVRSPVRLVLAGVADVPAYQERLDALVRAYDLGGRVHFAGWVSEERKADLMAGCCAALYLAYDEDSYGYVTLEAFQSSKPVITLTDTGGTDELVTDGDNGLVVEPRPEELARAIDRTWADRERARRLGAAGREAVRRLGIEWTHVLARLAA